jgi:hypothetical protein
LPLDLRARWAPEPGPKKMDSVLPCLCLAVTWRVFQRLQCHRRARSRNPPNFSFFSLFLVEGAYAQQGREHAQPPPSAPLDPNEQPLFSILFGGGASALPAKQRSAPPPPPPPPPRALSSGARVALSLDFRVCHRHLMGSSNGIADRSAHAPLHRAPREAPCFKAPGSATKPASGEVRPSS